MESEVKDHYGLLGISSDALPSVIKGVYRRLALKYHPDKNAGDANAQENFTILQDAYDILIDPDARELHDLKAEVYGTTPSAFLPPAPRFKAPKEEPKKVSKNEDIKEAFRKARLREKLEAERLRAEKEKLEAEEAARRIEQEKLQSIAAERIRAAREAQREAQEKEEQRWQERRSQEQYQYMASQRIRAERARMAREEERRREEERKRAEEEEEEQRLWEEEEEEEDKRRYWEEMGWGQEWRRRQEEERRRQEEQEHAERMKKPKVGKQSLKGEPPNNWGDEEMEMLVSLKRKGLMWAEISLNLNARFRNGRGKDACRKKYVKLRDNNGWA